MFKLHFDCGAVFLLPFDCILLHVGDVSCTHCADVSASDRCRLFMLEFDCGVVLCCRSFVSLLHWSTSFQLQSSEVHVDVISVLFECTCDYVSCARFQFHVAVRVASLLH